MGYQKVLVVGSGGREHAICWAASRSAATIFVAPGNGGTRGTIGTAEIVPVECTSIADIVEFVKKEKPELVIVGPEVPLVDGLVDALKIVGVPCFGPSKLAAELEGSKAFSKDFMVRHGIPSARHASFTAFAEAEAHIRSVKYSVVVKASGLCAGKGVVIPRDVEEAVSAARSILVERIFGDAGSVLVVEERLEGVEASVLAFADGKTVVPLSAAQDHKRIHSFDRGPNTGGMGAFAPSPAVTPSMMDTIMKRVLQPTIDGMAAEGRPYVGVLYAGIMISPDGTPNVLEFNCRLGDPETQVVLPLLETDFLSVVAACIAGTLAQTEVRVKKGVAAATIVMASEGYPGVPTKGVPISISPSLSSYILAPEARTGTMVFHAGTAWKEGKVVTAGGRVLAVTSLGPSITSAVRASYAAIDAGVSFKGMQARRDIAGVFVRAHADSSPLRIGVLGSTRGSSLAPLLAAIQSGELLGAEVVVVISNKEDAGILEKAKSAGIASVFISSAGKSREAFDAEAIAILSSHAVDVVLLVGFMRILSPVFIDAYAWRILNVHPSLLPDFAGLMDLDVHKAVLDAGRAVTGCTVHFVDIVVDAGPPLIQTRVEVSAEDTADSLKAKVQASEGPALIAAVKLFTADAAVDLLTLLRKAGADWAKVGPMFADNVVPRAVASRTRGNPTGRLTYAAAGVDIDAGDELVERIKPLAKSTARPGADADLGGFGGLFDLKSAGYKDPLLVCGTDGVGTKLRIALHADVHTTVGIDLVAMSVNDILVQGAEPLIFLDYFACGRLEVGVAAQVIEGIAEGCRQSLCALVGGETAEMPSMYAEGDYDLAGFAVGAVERDRVLPRMDDIRPGDTILGLASSGVHSNGFSLARRIVSAYGANMQAPPPFPSSAPRLCDAFLTPTKIYVRALLPSIKEASGCKIKAMAHITGGGLPDNIPRVLPDGLQAVIDMTSWPMPPVFTWMQSVGNGVEPAEMARTFNCGLGMVLVVAPEDAAAVRSAVEACGETVYTVGHITAMPSDQAPRVKLERLADAFTGTYGSSK